jgi:hypothetical protein
MPVFYFEKEEFIEKYNQLKGEGLLENEIARRMSISQNTLLRNKHRFGIPLITMETRELTNENGLSLEMLKKAKEIGLTSSMVNQRIRTYNWTVEEACTIPPLEKGGRKKNVIRNK